MLFERFEDDSGLSHYSYLIGCPKSGRAAVVDPRRDVDVYETFAHRSGLAIDYVLETHIHADFASGGRELAHRSGAEHWLSAYDEGELFDVSFPHTPMHEGDAIVFGGVRIEALHTPGHTPEHLAFLVYERDRSETVPELMLSGDFLFVGSLGRPDLLGDEAKVGLAKRLYASVRDKLAPLPDGLEVHPAHGAGSMCGAGMSGRPMSTLGFERLTNPFLNMTTEAEFVARILGNVPPFPDYYRRMKQVNSDGPALLGDLPPAAALEAAEFRRLIEQGHIVIDARSTRAFGKGHIPGSFAIGAAGNSSMWSAWVVPYDVPMLLVADDGAQMDRVVRGLVRVGHDLVVGHLDGAMAAWTAAGYPVASTPQITARELAGQIEAGADLHVLDVRGDEEFDEGHIADADHIMAGHLPARLHQVPNGGGKVAIVCRSGYRSTVAASVLERAGFTGVMNVAGGMNAWRAAGLPMTTRGMD
jgi:hydroxyacylglutathione hydrolase